MRAFIGLGNPGRQYQQTRHNIGFSLLDYIQRKCEIPFGPGKGDYYFSKVLLAGQDILLVKPVTYMNRSGFAVAQVMENFSISREDLLIIYDDFHLPFGEIRFRTRGSSAGHNGLNSIIYQLESEEFNRLKMGIGTPQDDTVDYVLSEFSETEKPKLEIVFRYSLEALELYLKEGMARAMNTFNRKRIDQTEQDNQNQR